MDILNNFSTREKTLWSELIVDIAVGLYYFPKLFFMLAQGEQALTGEAMAGLVVSTVVVAIITSIVVAVLLHDNEKTEQADERDNLFRARGNMAAYVLLVLYSCLLMGQIVISEMLPEAVSNRMVFDLSPIVIAHLMMVGLVFSSSVKVIVQLFSYRRGY